MEEKKEIKGIPIPNAVFEDRRQEEWKSKHIDKLASALSKAQAEMKGAKKSSVNPFFKSTYADLHAVIESSIPFLSKHGLLHESGQWVRSKLKMPVTKADAQGIGSTITYGRRYGLSAICGIAQYDDDGNSISKNK